MSSFSKTDFMNNLFKYFCFFLAFYILNCASVSGLYPFCFGLFFCLVWCNQKVYILAPLYILASVLYFGDYFSIVCSGSTVLVMLIAYIFHYKFKRPFNTILICLYAILSQLVTLYFSITMNNDIINAVLTIIIGIVVMLAYIHFFQNLLLRGIRRKFQVTEAISGGIFLIALSNGIYNLPYIGSMAISVVVAFCLLLGVRCFGASVGLYLGAIFGIGVAFATNSLVYIALFACWAIVVSAMQSNKKIYACLGLILIDILIEVYFLPTYTFYNFGAVLVGVLLYLLLPNKVLEQISNIVINEKETNAMSTLLNRERDTLYKRLQNLSVVFKEMQNAFCSMTRQNLTSEQMQTQVVGKVKQNICSSCPNKSNCLRTFEDETNYALSNMANYAECRGKVNIIDVPTALSCRCNRLGAVLNEVNKEVLNYKDKRNIVESQNISRLIIAEQLFGISQVMQGLADSVASRIEFDAQKEKNIIETLGFNNILCIEAVVYKIKNYSYHASLVVKDCDIVDDTLIEVVGLILNQPMIITKKEPAKKPKFTIINMQLANTFDMVFGCSGAKKSGSTESGDTHSILRISADKFLLALCDGMGSGDTAEKNSSLAISLIENFYKAGFESEVVLGSVNKLLAQNGEETFNALDIGVVDLTNGNCDLYKVGSPCSFIKQPNETTLIPAGALPLGILDDLKPSVTAKVLVNGDMLIFLSDGITDAFEDEVLLRDYIDMCDTTNPQTLADAILNESLKLNQYAPRDDMTVLVGRIYRK